MIRIRCLFMIMAFFYVLFCFGNNTTVAEGAEFSLWEKIAIIAVAFIIVSLSLIFISANKEKKKHRNEGRQQTHNNLSSSLGYEELKPNKKKTTLDYKEKIDELNAKIEKYEKENTKLKNEIDSLKYELKQYQTNPNAVRASTMPSIRGGDAITNGDHDNKDNNLSSFSYIYLTVLEGPLEEASPEHAIYYKAWREKGVLYFVFDNNENTKRAINNRTSIIEPFCEKSASSKSPEESESVFCKEPGILYDDYSVKKKVQIEYK